MTMRFLCCYPLIKKSFTLTYYMPACRLAIDVQILIIVNQASITYYSSYWAHFFIQINRPWHQVKASILARSFVFLHNI